MESWIISCQNKSLFNQLIQNIVDNTQFNVKNDLHMICDNDLFGTTIIENEQSSDKPVIEISDDDSDNPIITLGTSLKEVEGKEITLSEYSQKKTVTNRFKDVSKYLLDTLETDGMLLQIDDVIQITSDYSQEELTQVFQTLQTSLSAQGIYHLCLSFCNGTERDQHDLITLLCATIILPKVLDSDYNRCLELSLIALTKHSTELICDCLLIPMLYEKRLNNLIYSVIEALSISDRVKLLRRLLLSIDTLEERHLQILQNLYSSETDNYLKRRIIELMNKTAITFCHDKIFVKLLMTVLQSLDHNFLDLKMVLQNIIVQNQTIFKRSAMKSFNSVFEGDEMV